MNPLHKATECFSSLPDTYTSVFPLKQTLHRSFSRADAQSNKKAEISQILATKYTLRINLEKKLFSSDKEEILEIIPMKVTAY